MTINPVPAEHTSADVYVGEQVQALMFRARVTRRDLGALLGVEGPTVSRKLRGERTWTLDELLAVARHFGVGVEVLLPGPDYEPTPMGRGRGGILDTPRYVANALSVLDFDDQDAADLDEFGTVVPFRQPRSRRSWSPWTRPFGRVS